MNDASMISTLSFAELRKVNVSDFVEKKNGLSYLSWAWAVDQLLQRDPGASWEYRWQDNAPLVKIGDTAMVFCTVKAFGVERTAQLPVMDYRNRPIPNPNSFELNTAMQRCLAKAISLHGLGLYIYAGEDVPDGVVEAEKPAPSITPAQVNRDHYDALPQEVREWIDVIAHDIRAMLVKGDAEGAYAHLEAQNLEPENKSALWSLLDSKERSAIKKQSTARKGA